MRPLTPTLLAAQRAPGAVPAVRARIEDRELRWTCLLGGIDSARPTAGCTTRDALVRVRISAAGALEVQRIDDPAAGDPWQVWTLLAADANPASDVAISAEDADGDHLRAFYVRGSDPYRVSWLQSADGGRTWSAPSDCFSGLESPSAGLASANAQLFYHDPGDHYLKLALRSGWDTGGWAVHVWAGSGALPTRYGLAAGFREGVYYLASCDEEAADMRRLRTGAYDPATDAWTGPTPIVPPGLPAAAFAPKYPSLCFADGCWHLSYLETLSGVLAYAEPTLIHSADWDHWSFACWVPLDATVETRPVLMSLGATYYLSYERTVWQAAAYREEDGDKYHVEPEVAGYTVEEQPWYGYAQVELYNPGDRYRSLQQAGTPGAALRPLARLVLERGYQTSVGEERVGRTPYYIISAAIRRGGQGPTLQLECEDGWGLLRRWRPDALYVWSGKSIRWLIAEVLYRATGLSCRFDSDPAWDMTLAGFALAPSNWDDTLSEERRAWLARERRGGLEVEGTRDTGLGAVRTLLAKVSGAGCWQVDGALYCYVPAAQALCNPYIIGQEGEIHDGLYGCSLRWPTQARVFGEGAAGSSAVATGQGYTRRYLATSIDADLRTWDSCLARARGLVQEGQARAFQGWVETPCQCGLELGDLLQVADEHAPFGLDEYLRAAGIVEQYGPAQGVFRTRVMIEGA